MPTPNPDPITTACQMIEKISRELHVAKEAYRDAVNVLKEQLAAARFLNEVKDREIAARIESRRKFMEEVERLKTENRNLRQANLQLAEQARAAIDHAREPVLHSV